MRIINKKCLLIILLAGVIITGAVIFKPKEKVQLDNVILKQELNNKTFAMYKEEDDNNYVPVNDTKFPDMYVLNIEMSKCIDNNGNELKNVLSYENDKVTITSGNTTYCYLYFDKSLGLEIKEKNPNKLSTEIKGAMYRFQGQQSDGVNNYICFGTSDKEQCKQDTDHHMYRIIGIEAETGRVKVIKKEALDESMAWADNDQDNIEFPDSKIYEAIKGDGFLTNTDYVPEGWKEKISDNTWMYGDMITGDFLGARQTGEGLYLVENGKNGTVWNEKANNGDAGAQPGTVENPNSALSGQVFYYIRRENEKWTKSLTGKVSLMYLHDYYYSVSDSANCMSSEENYVECKSGWMHLSQNDQNAPIEHEWTMTRVGWNTYHGRYLAIYIRNDGAVHEIYLAGGGQVLILRPVFYIDASQTLKDGIGTIDDPFTIN